MKQLFLLLTLFAVSFAAKSENIKEVRETLKWVESQYNPDALGDYVNGEPTAYGILQIRKIAVDDVNRVYGTTYKHEDAFNVKCANEIFELYISYWTDKLEQREGRKATSEDIIRIWNGGPRGYQKQSTNWHVEKYLKVRKNAYLCYNETNAEQSEVLSRRKAWSRGQKVYAYRRCPYLQDT